LIIDGQNKDICGDVLTCNALWEGYYQHLSELYGDSYLKSEIKNNGFVTGQLDSDLTSRLIEMVEQANVIAFSAADSRADFAFSPNVSEYESAINSDHQYLDLTTTMLWQVNTLLTTMDPIIQNAIGTPWRALNVRVWKTTALAVGAETIGSLDWHDDGMPKDMLKLLVYLTDLSLETGSVEWKVSETETTHLIGPAGSWLLFQNSVVFHRGRPPTEPGTHRTLLEITLTPSAMNVPTIVRGGNNARHPWRYWQTDLT